MCKHFYLSKRLLPPYSSLLYLLPNYLLFFLHISPIFCIFAPSITISGQNYINYSYSFPKQTHYATKPVFNYGPHRTRPTLLSLHHAQVCLGETKVAHAGRSGLIVPDKAPASHLPPCRSKHYLPTPRAAMSCPFIL